MFSITACNPRPDVHSGTADEDVSNPAPDVDARAQLLLTFLKSDAVAQEVLTLAKLGQAKYSDGKDGLYKARKNAKSATGGGRTVNWIQDTFGKSENEILSELAKIDGPPTWSIEEIDRAFAIATENFPKNIKDKPTFISVAQLGVNYLYDTKAAVEGGFSQLASQYNFLESTSTNHMPVSKYLTDATQGPQGSIEAAAAALHRTAAEKAGKLKHALIDILPPGHNFYYKNGYLELAHATPQEQQDLLKIVKRRIGKLRLLAQPVMTESSGAKLFQVFSAAPSWQGFAKPSYQSTGGQIANALVTAQYAALAKLAVIKAVQTKTKIPVHLTFVGQSAFNNPPEVITAALKTVAEVVNGFDDVVVFLQAYSGHGESKSYQGQPPNFSLKEMDVAEFSKIKSL